MGALLQIAVEMMEINCSCGGVYAITEKFLAYKHDVGGSWNCPYCQVDWGYSGNGKLQLAEKALAEEKERTRLALVRANEAVAGLAAAQFEAKRLATRTKNGVCPCCNRTFKHLMAHMKGQHPEYSK